LILLLLGVITGKDAREFQAVVDQLSFRGFPGLHSAER